MLDEQVKANEAFHQWEADNNEQNMSDRDRMIWTAGWIDAQARTTLLAWALSNLLETADSYIEEGSYIEQLNLEIEYSRGLLQSIGMTEFLEDEEDHDD